MPLRLEEMVGSAQEAGALVGPVLGSRLGACSASAPGSPASTSARVGVARAAIAGPGAQRPRAPWSWAWSPGPAGLIAAYLFTYSMHGMNGPPHAALLHREAQAQQPRRPCCRSTR